MALTGSLKNFPLSEIFELIATGSKTGVVTLCASPHWPGQQAQCYYFWVEEGHLVAAASCLDNLGLASLIIQQQWLSKRVIAKLLQLCPSDRPLGLYLEEHGVLTTEQLQKLFFYQVLKPAHVALKLKQGQINFDQDVSIPAREKTGLAIPATEVIHSAIKSEASTPASLAA